MPQKKTKKTKPKRRTVTLRFDAAELEAIDADRRDITSGGIPVGRGAYCKHAVANFARLRKIEGQLKRVASDSETYSGAADPEAKFAASVLSGAT